MILEVDPSGLIAVGAKRWRCALGRGGVRADKCEGDGATPVGTFGLGRVFYRPDRFDTPPATGLQTVALKPDWGWCDDPDADAYNTLIPLPHPARHEILWRDDGLYDVIVEIHYNDAPVRPGFGSAIFLHIAKPNYAPTEGCIALKRADLLDLLQMCSEDVLVRIPAPEQA